jgi:hypothetical protein
MYEVVALERFSALLSRENMITYIGKTDRILKREQDMPLDHGIMA